MKIIFLMAIIIMMINFILIIILNLISKKTFMDREKSSPFECGFDPKNTARLPFSLQFFLVAVIFLIFDVEITLLLPLVLTVKYSSMFHFSTMVMFFISVLIVGLYHEWEQGALDWAN
uniref:NADH-ubiquinone oxidoreductase chain 3 n=1 Tax=Agapanthia daurica TaxID=763897 RepID=A0A343ERL9_9CUCU|nr:NADH dehydrogenase subunit 3 [Agapanthia daurica]